MQAISLFAEIFSDKSQLIEFDSGHCLRKRLNSCECSYCVDICSTGALILKNRAVRFNNKKCTGCMQCYSVCPNEAFQLSNFEFDKIIQFQKKEKKSVFNCPRQNQISTEDKIVPCLGLLSLELLLVLGMTGPPAISFNISHCFACENKASSDSFLKRLQKIEEQLSHLLTTKFAVLTSSDRPAQSDGNKRRYFISNVWNNCTSAVKSQFLLEKLESVEIPSKTRRVPYKTKLLKRLIDLLGDEGEKTILPLCSHQLSINNNCTLCPLCTGICPTGAIKLERLHGAKKLLFNATLCSGCGLCESFCKKNAISIKYPFVSQVLSFEEVPPNC